MNSSVYVNGHYAGGRPYGYASFSIDATPWIKPGGENVIAVKVDNSEQPNSRWYSGCGIYRNVWLRPENKVFIPKYGTYITTTGNDINIAVNITNLTSSNRKVNVNTTVTDSDGNMVASASMPATVSKRGEITVDQSLPVKSPQLWSPASPALYTVTTELTDAKSGKTLDTDVTRTGFRTFAFDATKGFSLNGERMKAQRRVSAPRCRSARRCSEPRFHNTSGSACSRIWGATPYAAPTIRPHRNCSTCATRWDSS